MRANSVDGLLWVSYGLVGVLVFAVLPLGAMWLAERRAPPGRRRAPKIDRRLTALLPWVAAALFTASWRLPNPDLAQTTTFTQHAVGGGASCATLSLWMCLRAGVGAWWLRVAFAFALASSLGVTLEVGELALDEWRGTNLTSDVSWDLLANSAGVVVTALLLELAIASGGQSISRGVRRQR